MSCPVDEYTSKAVIGDDAASVARIRRGLLCVDAVNVQDAVVGEQSFACSTVSQYARVPS